MKDKNFINEIYNKNIAQEMHDEFGDIKKDYIEQHIRQLVFGKEDGCFAKIDNENFLNQLHKLDYLEIFLVPDMSEHFEYHESSEYANEVDFKNVARVICYFLQKELKDSFDNYLKNNKIKMSTLNELLLDRAKNGDIEISNLLIAKGANPTVADSNGVMAIKYLRDYSNNASDEISRLAISSLALVPVEILLPIILVSVALMMKYFSGVDVQDYVFGIVGATGIIPIIHSSGAIIPTIANRVINHHNEEIILQIAQEKYQGTEKDLQIPSSNFFSFHSLPYTTREEIRKVSNDTIQLEI